MSIASGNGEKTKSGMEGPAEMEMGPQMLTVSGGKPLPNNSGQLDDSARRRRWAKALWFRSGRSVFILQWPNL